MGYITLAAGIIFDVIDGEGCLIHLLSGISYALDPLTTMLLEAGLYSSTREDAILSVRERVEADEQRLVEGFEILLQQLQASHLLGTEAQNVSISQQPNNLAEEALLSEQSQRAPHSTRERRVESPALFANFFLTGQLEPAPLPQISWLKRAVAIGHMMALLLVLGYYKARMALWRKSGKQRSQVREQAWRCLCLILSTQSRQPLSQEAELGWRLARRELEYSQMILRFFAPTARCLTRSAAFCVYLRSLGFSAHVVVGRPRFYPGENHFAFHAWTELGGQVVNDHAELQSGYTVMARIPSP